MSDLIAEGASIKLSAKYSDFPDIFSSDSASKLPKHTGINNHFIKLVNDKQLSYRTIYSLGPVELEILKTYIETNLANRFIRSPISPAGVPIMFDQKPDGSLRLYIGY